MARNLKNGVPLAPPVFDGATEEEITQMLELAYPDDIAEKLKLTETRSQAWLVDCHTGEQYERQVTIGYLHYLHLHHLFAYNMHALTTRHTYLVIPHPFVRKRTSSGPRFG